LREDAKPVHLRAFPIPQALMKPTKRKLTIWQKLRYSKRHMTANGLPQLLWSRRKRETYES
jgi:hypothetical protein